MRIMHYFWSLFRTVSGIARLAVVVIILILIITVVSRNLLYAPSVIVPAKQVQGHAVGFLDTAMQWLEPVFQSVGLGSKNANRKQEQKKETSSIPNEQQKDNSSQKELKDGINNGERTPPAAEETSKPPPAP